MGHFTVVLLGTPQACHDGVPVTFPTRKTLGLLAYLAVEDGLHSREKLAALLWPESDPKQSRASLRYALTSLRRSLGDAESPHLVVERDVLGLDFSSDLDVDVRSVEAVSAGSRGPAGQVPAEAARSALLDKLQLAARLCRGEFLEGFSLRDAPDFDDWASLQREVWHRRMELVFDRLSQLQGDSGEPLQAIDTVTRWLAFSPLNEEAHQRLMRLFLAAGDRTAALRAYEACRRQLDKELGAEPAPETEALAERARGEGWRDTFPPVPVPVPPAESFEGPLVGRTNEFMRLVERYHAARQGKAQVVVIQGDAGIGKTRLATEFLGWAAGQGADVLGGRAFETGGRLPYQPLVDALRPRVERDNAPEDLLGDIWLAELSRLLPELRERYPDLTLPTGDEVTARTRLYEALARLSLALAARAPVVLFVDDMQWADAASLDVLRYAVRRWAEGGTSALLLISLRSEALDATPALREWLTGLQRDLPLTPIELAPLTFDDTLRLVQGWGSQRQDAEEGTVPPPKLHEFARWLLAETGGHPLFVMETLRALVERGTLAPRAREQGDWVFDLQPGAFDERALRGLLPPGVQQVIHARLVLLTPTASAIAAAAAVLGQGLAFEQLCRVADVSESEALPAMDELLKAHLLRETEAEDRRRAYAFPHDKIRDVVYLEAGDARRRIFHRRAFDSLRGGAVAAELAHHALAAGLDEPAVRHSLAAGDDAMRLLAARDAIEHYTRGMTIAERRGWADLVTHLRARRAKAYATVAMWADARCELEAALAGLGKDQQERRAELTVELAEVYWWLLDLPSMRPHATQAVALAQQVGRVDLETAAMGWLAGAAGADGDLPACIEQYGRASARAREAHIAPPANVVTLHSLALYWLGRLDEAAERSREGVRTARETNNPSVMMYSLPHLGLALAARGQYAEAALVFEEARRFGREYAVNALLARSIAMSSGLHLDLFDFGRAESLACEARELALGAGFPPAAASASIDLLLNYARRGEVGRALELVDQVAGVVEKAAGFHGWLWKLRLAEARAEIALAQRDWEGSLRWANAAIEQSRARRRVKYEVLGLETRAQALIALQRTKEAIADLRAAVGLARTMGATALFVRAAAALLDADGDDALAAEARASVERVVGALPEAELRRAFEAAEPVRIVAQSSM